MSRQRKTTSRKAPSTRAWAVLVKLHDGRTLYHCDCDGDRPWGPWENRARRFPTREEAQQYADHCTSGAVGDTTYIVVDLPSR